MPVRVRALQTAAVKDPNGGPMMMFEENVPYDVPPDVLKKLRKSNPGLFEAAKTEKSTADPSDAA